MFNIVFPDILDYTVKQIKRWQLLFAWNLEDVGADERSDGLSCVQVLAGDNGEVGDDGLGVERELPERRPVLRDKLVHLHLLLGAGRRRGAIGGVRSGVPRGLREALLLVGGGRVRRRGSAGRRGGGGGGLHGGAHGERPMRRRAVQLGFGAHAGS